MHDGPFLFAFLKSISVLVIAWFVTTSWLLIVVARAPSDLLLPLLSWLALALEQNMVFWLKVRTSWHVMTSDRWWCTRIRSEHKWNCLWQDRHSHSRVWLTLDWHLTLLRKPEVTDTLLFTPATPKSRDEMIKYFYRMIGAAELGSEHPLGKAIVKHAKVRIFFVTTVVTFIFLLLIC